jgi:hypothetical protein
MTGAFRDELEAARSRADVLREENDELREELEELRRKQPAPQETSPTRLRLDTELAKLTESTLERLEHLNEEVDAHGHDRRKLTESTLERLEHLDEEVAPRDETGATAEEPAPLLHLHPPRPHGKTPAAAEPITVAPAPMKPDALPHSAEVTAELAALRDFRRRAVRWIGAAFLAGIALGAGLVGVLR